MTKFELTNKAVEDLEKIWNYTYNVWSEQQADDFYEMLISKFQDIANNPKLGKNFKGITPKLFGIKANRHIIFYRTINENYVEITRILHERMDLKNRILE
ncbi:MAG: type II toxin-antitoxin system RelE/ParE family toxin [Ignavibacteriae bacterium]|nr:type II toxin-antitoxin system RelE/ParE family toxin [Ignavibacteriota bacterium]NOG97608.1 type II toxin-antitoxin system RelE/ParE family toxin [Ignavibacteriota bacterium]